MRLRLTLLTVALTLVVAGCNKQPMTEFKSPEYKFKAKFPGKPKAEDQMVRGVRVKTFAVESRNGMSGVFVSDMPIPANEPDAKIQDRLDGARDGAIGKAGGTQLSS